MGISRTFPRISACWPQLREVEHEQDGLLDRTQLIVREMPHVRAQTARVYGADHLAENLRWLALDLELWVEARGERRP
jgi:hypothetical protein